MSVMSWARPKPNHAGKSKVLATASSKEVSANKCDTGVQPEINMAAKAGNTNIFEIVSGRIEIPTANLGFSTSSRSCSHTIYTGNSNVINWLSPGYYDNYRQLEMAIWLLKPELHNVSISRNMA